MFHLYLLFHILSFAVGVSAILLFLLLYMKTRTRLAKLNLCFLSACTLYMATALFRRYLVNYVGIGIELHMATYLFYFVIMGMLLYYMPRFFHALTGSDYKHGFQLFWNMTVIAQPVMVFLPLLFGVTSEEINRLWVWEYCFINNPLFVLSLLYCLIICIYSFQNIPHDFLKLIVKVVLISLVLFFPGIIYDVVTAHPEMINMERSPFIFTRVYYFIWNVGNIVLLFIYFQRRIDLSTTVGQVSDRFINDYLITPREKEVIELLMQKLTYAKIGERLFISPKTVERHISNIYRKTQSNGRENLIERLSSYMPPPLF